MDCTYKEEEAQTTEQSTKKREEKKTADINERCYNVHIEAVCAYFLYSLALRTLAKCDPNPTVYTSTSEFTMENEQRDREKRRCLALFIIL